MLKNGFSIKAEKNFTDHYEKSTSLPLLSCRSLLQRFLIVLPLEKRKLSQAGNDVQKIVSFGAGETLARVLNWGLMALLPLLLTSTEEYGRVGLIVSIEVLVANISLMGLDRVVLRFYSNDEYHGKLLKSIFAIWASFAWIPLVAASVLYFIGFKTLFGIPLVPHLFLLSVIVAIYNLNFLCVCIGRAKRDLSIFLRFRLSYMILKFICVLFLAKLVGHSFSYVLGIGLSAFIMLLFIVPFLKKISIGQVDKVVVGQLLIFGWPFVLHLISGNILSYFSRFFLEFYNSTKDVGIFTFAFTLGSSLYVAYAVLSTYFEPRIYSYADDKLRGEKWLFFYTNACIALSSVGGVLLLFLYPYLTPHLNTDFYRALPTISMLMGTILLTPLYLQGNYRLTSHKKTGYIAAASFISAFLSIGLNFLLIPRYGIWGAAMAMYISNFFLCAFILIISLRVSKIPLYQQSSFPTYLMCTFGSMSVLVWANKPEFAILGLLTVCMTSSAFLLKSFSTPK